MQLTFDDVIEGGVITHAREASSEPFLTFEHDGVAITLLGTAHVSKSSAIRVRELIESGEYDGVALELCQNRYQSLIDPESIAKMNLMQVIREGKGAVVTASLALGAFQQRIANQLDVEPGGEMKAAIAAADEANLPVMLIDRDIGKTLKRIYRNIPFSRRVKVLAGLVNSVTSRRSVSEDEIEQLKQGDVLASTFKQFSESAPDIYGPLVNERDRYMVARLFQEAAKSDCKKILVVVGAGHVQGMGDYADSQSECYLTEPAKVTAELDTVPAANRFIKLIPWLLVAMILSGFAIGFSQSSDVGWHMIQQWVVINGGFAAIGALLAAAHPVTVLSAFIAAPLTSLNPTISAGVVAAAVETWFRKPQVGDFTQLREATTSVKGWWNNRVARTLLVFLFAGMGSVVGTYVAGYKIFESIMAG